MSSSGFLPHDPAFRPDQQVLQLLDQSSVVEQPTSRFKLHQQIHVALRSILAPHNRAENPHVPRPIARRDREDLLPL
jgi:hypothetical protein